MNSSKETFYKGVLISDLKPNFIPGSVTKDFKEALQWKYRIESNKRKGATKHVKHGKACVIEIIYHGHLKDHNEFQRENVKEHSRDNCWMASDKTKAQINTVVEFRILTEKEIDKLLFSKPQHEMYELKPFQKEALNLINSMKDTLTRQY